jgi:predicted nucleic acid-binding protein
VIFVDTGFLIALFSKRDRHHQRAAAVFREFEGKRLADHLLTTDHVVFETVTFFVKKVSHERAVYVGERLYAEKLARIHRATYDEQTAAFAYLKRHVDKRYSAVDCLSFVVMDKLGIREALAVDEDFTHRFIARPGPMPRKP